MNKNKMTLGQLDAASFRDETTIYVLSAYDEGKDVKVALTNEMRGMNAVRDLPIERLKVLTSKDLLAFVDLPAAVIAAFKPE